MTTITWRRGETRHIGVRDEYADDAAQIRIGSPPACIIVAGSAQAIDDGAGGTVPGFAFTLDDAALVDLRNGLSPLTIWTGTGTAWVCRDASHSINVVEGC